MQGYATAGQIGTGVCVCVCVLDGQLAVQTDRPVSVRLLDSASNYELLVWCI